MHISTIDIESFVVMDNMHTICSSELNDIISTTYFGCIYDFPVNQHHIRLAVSLYALIDKHNLLLRNLTRQIPNLISTCVIRHLTKSPINAGFTRRHAFLFTHISIIRATMACPYTNKHAEMVYYWFVGIGHRKGMDVLLRFY